MGDSENNMMNQEASMAALVAAYIPRRREGGKSVLAYTRKRWTFTSFRLLNTETNKPSAIIIFTKSSLKYTCSTYLFFLKVFFLSLIDYFVMDSHTLSYSFQISDVDIVKKLLGLVLDLFRRRLSLFY